MNIPRTPFFFPLLFPKILFRIPGKEKIVYLTFDDGPHPIITPYVIQLLEEYQFKASFFTIGENVDKYPQTIDLIIQNNHRIGNHTYNHLHGWKTSFKSYIQNIKKADTSLKKIGIESLLFRPPYGKLSIKQWMYISKHFRLVLWDIIAEDYKNNDSPQKLLNKLIAQTRNGSIIVFHDSEKCQDNLEFILPKYFQFLKDNGYRSLAL